MADKHNKKPEYIQPTDCGTRDVAISKQIAIPAARMQNYLRNWRQQGQLFTYCGPNDLSTNPGFAGSTDNGVSNDAALNYYVILHGPPKIDSTGPTRRLGGVLIPWRQRVTYTNGNKTAIHSRPTIQWTAPPYETFSDVITDGDCETAGTGSWTSVNSASLTKQTADPWEGDQNLRVTATVAANPAARQAVLTGTKKYIVTCKARSGALAGEYPVITDGTTTWTGTTSTEWQEVRFEISSAAGLNIDFRVGNASSGAYCEFDDIKVLEATAVTPSASNLYLRNYTTPDYGGFLKYTEALTNGDFNTNTTGWTAANSTLSRQTSSPQEGAGNLRITATASGSSNVSVRAYQSSVQAGRSYMLLGYMRSDGTQIPRVQISTASTVTKVLWVGTASTSWQFFQVQFDAPASSTQIQLMFRLDTPAGTEYVEFDNLRMLEFDSKANDIYYGNDQIFTDHDMEVSGIAAFTQYGCTATKDTTVYKSGSQSLKLVGTSGQTNMYVLFSPGLTVGNEYRITGYCLSDGATRPWVSQDGTNNTLWVGELSSGWQYFDIEFTAAQTYIALRGSKELYAGGTSNRLQGTETVWFDNVEVWDCDEDISGKKLLDGFRKEIVLNNFFYVPPSDGGFCVGKITTNNIQTASLSVWSMPDTDLTAEQKRITESELLPNTGILGVGPDNKGKDIGEIYQLIGFSGNDYEDKVEQMTRRCLFQWGHGVGVYVSNATSPATLFNFMTMKITPRNIIGASNKLINGKFVETSMVVTTTNTDAINNILVTVRTVGSNYLQRFAITSNISSQILLNSDTNTGNPLFVKPDGEEIELTVTCTGTSEFLLHTLAFWETSDSYTYTDQVSDGDMEAVGVGSWTAGNSATLTKDTTAPLYEGTQHLRVAYNGVNNPYASQVCMNSSKLYRITGAARGDGTAYPRVTCDFAGYYTWTGTSSTSWQTFEIACLEPGRTQIELQAIASAAGSCDFDIIKVEEITQ